MPEWFHVVITMVGTAAGIYAAIKADLATLHTKCDEAMKSARTAHKRLDSHLEGKHEK